MKNYIAIAALGVAIITVFAALPGHSAATNTAVKFRGTNGLWITPIPFEESAVTPEREKAADVRREERKRILNLIEAKPVDRPELFVKDGGTNGTQIITVTTNQVGGPLTRKYNFGKLEGEARDYQPGAARLVTPVSQSHGPSMVFVVTSTDRTNWYPVSFGQTFPESEQPRYFLMWTEMDSVSFQQKRLDKIMAERRKNSQPK